eukprot:15328028-Ditylum_brightwellii.AAC.1
MFLLFSKGWVSRQQLMNVVFIMVDAFKVAGPNEGECCPKDEEKIIKPIHLNSIKELELSTRPESEAESKQLEVDEHITCAMSLQGSQACIPLPQTNKGMGTHLLETRNPQ